MTALKSYFSSISLAVALTIGVAGGVVTSPVVSAQNSAPILEEVTVSARKRDESLLDVPLTISVLTADDIDKKGVRELDQVVDFTPGFFYGGPSVGANSRNNRRLLMRGMQFNTDVQTKQGATMFIDGAPVLGAEVGRLNGIERIEVVKGPQSAYFGRATFAGAINVITRRPSNEWQGRVRVEAGSFGTTDLVLGVEGPLLQDKLSFRFDASQYETDGQYRNALNAEKLGQRETRDVALTLYATPFERFSAKLRLHYWEDDDGAPAGFTYARGNAQDAFNCRLSGAAGSPGVNGTNNWICGVPRFPTPAEISLDTTLTPDVLARLTNSDPAGQYLLSGSLLDRFGLAREAYETSLALDYEFANGWKLSSITAKHQNEYRSLDDLDRRATASQGQRFNWILLSDQVREDFSQELRLSSPDGDQLHWLIGLNYSDIKSQALTNSRLLGPWTTGSGIATNKVETSSAFGSLGYDFSDRWSASLEGRYQEDKVTDGVERGSTLSGTFTSFTPRAIVEFKPTPNQTIYASYSEGTRPGSFNANVPTLPPSVLACLLQSAAGDLAVPEEELTNYELGFKGRLWNGRAQMTAAVYSAEWRKQNNRGGAICPFPNGTTQTVFVTGSGGSTDLQGIELEGSLAATDNLTLEASFALNDTKILKRDCSDCIGILGFSEIAGLGKEFSRTPRVSGTFSANYQGRVSERTSWFVRSDYIFRASTWATEANIAETGDVHRVNLRTGFDVDSLAIEFYATNLFNDKTFTGFQRFTDGATAPNATMLTAGLPDKRAYGVRATYRFGAAK